MLQSPPEDVLDFAHQITHADRVIIVTPEYNGGYPASLNVITSLQYSLWKIRSWTVPAMFPVAKVGESFDEQGAPSDKPATDKRASRFIDELLWCMEAKKKMSMDN